MNRQHGFNFPETLIALAIAAILAAYGIGNMSRLLAGNTMTGLINTLVSNLMLARSHAITKQQYVLLCPSADGMHCDYRRDWQHGWLLRAADSEAAVLSPSTAHLILRHHRFAEPLTVYANREYFLYRPHARRAINGTLIICHSGATPQGKAVIVSYTGRPRVSRRLSDGRPVRC